MFHPEDDYQSYEGQKDLEEYEEQVQKPVKQSRFRSIPLRTHRQPKAGAMQERQTTRSHVVNPDVLRGVGTRAPIMKTRPAQAQVQAQPVQKQQSFVSHTRMPALPDEDQLYKKPNPNTTRREVVRATPTDVTHYVDPYGRDVYEQGNRRIVKVNRPKPRLLWLFFAGLGMLAMFLLWIFAQWAIGAIRLHNDDSTYGNPRTYQTDAVVGHNDSALHPSHFIFENLNGHVLIIEICGGDPSHDFIYSGPQIYDVNASLVPVTGKFEDINHDGRPDMVVSVNGQTIVFLNNGTKFVPQS